MVDEDAVMGYRVEARVEDGVLEVAGGGELVGVPGQVDVEGGHGHALRVRDHDVEEDFVFVD